MKKTTNNKKLVVGRETVKALTPRALAEVEGGNAAPTNPHPQPVSTDSVNVCCA